MSPKKKASTANTTDTVSHGTVSQIEAVFQPAPDFKLIYVNFIQSAFSPLDVALTLGEVTGADGDKWVVQTKTRVTMTPVEAKIFQGIISNTIKNYEDKFGEIVVPEILMPHHED